MDKKNEQWAVFWCDLLQPIIYEEISPEETNRYLKTLSRKKVVYPDGQCRRPSLSTLKRKLSAYWTCGFDGLARKPRTDRGKNRKVSDEIIETAIALKKERHHFHLDCLGLFCRRLHKVINSPLLHFYT